MQNLVAPSTEGFAVFKAIVRAKKNPRKERLQVLEPKIERRYKVYHAAYPDIESLTPLRLSKRRKADLAHCYTAATEPLRTLKAQIRSLQSPLLQSQCQYCGINPSPGSMDHYLPKETYPEFSTLPLNLVPCCLECNQAKGTAWLKGATRAIINFYFDVLPTRRFLSAKLLFDAAVPKATFSLSSDEARYNGLRATIRSHFEELDLLNRFAQASVTEISEALGTFQASNPRLSRDEVVRLLQGQETTCVAHYSTNHWKAVLTRAMVRSSKFVDLCV